MRDDETGNDNTPQVMPGSDMLVELMDLMSQESISNNKLRKILAYVERVVSEQH